MATIKLLLAVLCFALIGSSKLYRIYSLTGNNINADVSERRQQLIKIAERELGVRELTGNNDGERVEAYLAAVKLKKPDPYCAAFVSWVFAQAGLSRPRSGWSPDLFPASRLARSALPADVLGIYFPEKKRIAHVGLIVLQKGSWIYSIEANTNLGGSREGSGVYRRVRHYRTISKIADWAAERGKVL